MSVTELHPEDLLEREESGSLSASERALLDAHLAQCSACRFERLARQDFAGELAAASAHHDGAIRVSTAIRVAAEQRSEEAEAQRAAGTSPEAGARALERLAPRRSAPRRLTALILVAASFLLATASFAAVRTGSFASILRAAGIELGEPEKTSAAETPASPRAMKARATSATKAPSLLEGPIAATEAPSDPAPIETSHVEPAPTVAPVAPLAAMPAAPAVAPRVLVATSASASPSARSPESAPATRPTERAEADAATLFTDASSARRRGDRLAATRAYRELFDRFPSSPEASSARVAFARLLLDDGAPADALRHFEAYLDGRDGAVREEALVGRARALERLGRADEERRAWSMVLDRYPASIHAERARRRLAELTGGR